MHRPTARGRRYGTSVAALVLMTVPLTLLGQTAPPRPPTSRWDTVAIRSVVGWDRSTQKQTVQAVASGMMRSMQEPTNYLGQSRTKARLDTLAFFRLVFNELFFGSSKPEIDPRGFKVFRDSLGAWTRTNPSMHLVDAVSAFASQQIAVLVPRTGYMFGESDDHRRFEITAEFTQILLDETQAMIDKQFTALWGDIQASAVRLGNGRAVFIGSGGPYFVSGPPPQTMPPPLRGAARTEVWRELRALADVAPDGRIVLAGTLRTKGVSKRAMYLLPSSPDGPFGLVSGSEAATVAAVLCRNGKRQYC
jgi:hypothetical protein